MNNDKYENIKNNNLNIYYGNTRSIRNKNILFRIFTFI